MKKTSILGLALLLIVACTKNDTPLKNQTDDTKEQSFFEMLKTGTVVGGDMLVTPANQTHARSVVVDPTYSGNYTPVQSPYNRGITVKMKRYGLVQGAYSVYSEALDKAINNWNSLMPRSDVSFERVDSNSTASVEMILHDFGNTTWGGLTVLPVGGRPSKYVALNDYFLKGWPNADYITTLITHELGHVMGFGHCNDTRGADTSYIIIPGLPYSPYTTASLLTVPWTSAASNPNSIMNAGEGYGEWTQAWSNITTSIICGYYVDFPTTYTNVGQYNNDLTYSNKGFTLEDIHDIEYIYPFLPKTVLSTGRPNSASEKYYTIDHLTPGCWPGCWRMTKVVGNVESEFTAQDYLDGWVPYISQTYGGLTEVRVTFPTNTSGAPFTLRLKPTIQKGTTTVSESIYSAHPSYIDIYVP